ncbi:MAG: penicillin-binding protein 1C, partial [Chitinophagales bacterium]
MLKNYQKFIGVIFICVCLISFSHAWFKLKIETDYSTIVTSDDQNILYAFLNKDDRWRMKTDLNEITPELTKAILFKEDKYFYYHFGINPFAIIRAFFNNITKKERTSGASTITMQVARMLNPKPRTYTNKLLEMFHAFQLEWTYTKKEILQLYINLIPYGGNIEGVKSAAVLYFDKAPNHLSLAEVTTLAIIPNRPTSLRLGHNNETIRKVRNKWLNRFKSAQLFPQDIIEDALQEPLEVKRLAAPRIAPHFSLKMKQRHPHKDVIKTNLNLNKQLITSKLVHNYVQRLYYKRITNAAVLVINNQTQEVEAYVGSADFNNRKTSGQVDGIQAIRSPGSTLKPYLYGLAFDKGLLTFKTTISDVPVNFTGYSPVNYSGNYEGMVSIEHALSNSLNIPAVKVANQMGVDYFIHQLSLAGFEQIQADQNKLGLSVVLGGCGATLEELTQLYSSFAHQGQYQSFAWLASDTSTTTTTILSPAAAHVVTETLTQLTRPDLPKNYTSSKNLPKVAWKTGTSYGRRDAWSIGYNSNYTIGVWVGNFSGEGVPELTGADIATPLLFDIFNTIDYAPQKDWFIAPKSLSIRWVCSATGLPPSDYCEDQIMEDFLPLVSPTKKCSHLQKIWLSADEKFSYCTSCLPANGYKKKHFPNLSPEIITFYEQAHIHYDKPPPHNPKCERIFSGQAPEITSPVANLDYLIDPTDNTQLMLTANTTGDVSKV